LTGISRHLSWTLILLAVLCSLSITSAAAQQSTLWEIGKNDKSAREFSAGPRSAFVFDADKDNWTTAWPAEQEQGVPYTIEFPLNGSPSGGYVLHIDTLAATPVIPALRVDVNGHSGNFYLRPRLTDSAVEPNPVSLSNMQIEIPAAYLHSGVNRIVLTCVDTRSAPAPRPTTPAIRYDYLSLTHSEKATAQSDRADLQPTIYYLQRAGKLVEEVDAFLRFRQPAPASTAELRINGQALTAPLAAQQGFGEQKITFEVPEWSGPARARLSIDNDPKAFDFTVRPARKWTLCVVPHTHLDIGYTDFQGKVAEEQARTLQDAINMIHEHPGFRFATDGSWNAAQFFNTRPAGLQQELAAMAKDGKIGIPANYANLLTGYSSLETLYRSLYYSKSLERSMGIPFDYASITDVPSYTGAYPSVLASAGLRYLVAAGNGDRGPVLQHELWNAKSPFWWEGTDGQKILFWYSRGYGQIESIFGLPPQIEGGHDTLPLFLSEYAQHGYKPDAVLIYGAQSENSQLYPELAGFAEKWNSAYAYPKLHYATFVDFFRYIDKKYGPTLPTYKGDFGPYWEDGVAADAAHTAQDRANQNRALSAEIAATAAHSLGLGFHAPKAELDSAWRNIVLYSEHTWTGGMSVTQPDMDRVVAELAFKDNHAVQAGFELEDIGKRAMGQIADQIHVPANSLVVFNALNWKRSVLIETDLRKHEHLIDLSTGREIPAEVLWRKEGFTRARFIIPDVPAMGYKCLHFQLGDADVPDQKQVSHQTTIENRFYRVRIDPQTGSIQSIFDKQLNREIVNESSPYRFGQYLYVTGGDGDTRIIHSDPGLPVPKLTIHAAHDGKYLRTTKTPWGDSIVLESSDVNTPLVRLEVLLFDNEKKIELNYTVEKQYSAAKEGVYFAFPVAVAQPHFSFDLQQGWIDPSVDLMKGGSAEWFTVQHWMAVHDQGLAVAIVPIDAPMATFGDIVRGTWPDKFSAKSSTLFSYPMNNYWHTNYQAGQSGELRFRYVLTSSSHFAPAAFTRLGWESMEPLEMNRVIPPDKVGNPARPLPASGASFLEVDGNDVVLTDWKLAENGKGTIVRLEEIGGNATEATIRVPRRQLRAATLCNAVEDDLHELEVQSNAVHVNLKPYQVVTLRLQTGDAKK
ncbi:MAG TPA: polysaccharide lyase family protein, partial [Acidobacteriaceae bacterium]|nr:polysaccharide lyase family protein [Acidobacteriaceae bacterium]